MIFRYCKNLRKLRLNSVTLYDETLDILQTKPMETLEFIDTLNSVSPRLNVNLDHLVPVGSNLKVLSLQSINRRFTLSEKTFPNLRQLNLIEIYELIDEESLCRFLELNPLLNKLTIQCMCALNSSRLLYVIGNQLKHLEVLDFRGITWGNALFEKAIIQLANLPKLRNLSLDFQNTSISPLMECFAKTDTPIEELTLRRASIDEIGLGTILKMKQISCFHLTDCDISAVNLNDFFQNLQNLKKFSAFDSTPSLLKYIMRHVMKRVLITSFLHTKYYATISGKTLDGINNVEFTISEWVQHTDLL